MRFKKSNLVKVLVVALVILTLAGCGQPAAQSASAPANSNSSQASSTPVKLVYGGSSWLGHYPAYIGVQKGFFKDAGFDVEFKSYATSSDRMTGLAAGQVDIASTGAISAISMMASGSKGFYVVGSPDIYVGQEGIIANADIKTIADLKGKKIGVPFSSSSQVIVYDALKQANLVPNKDVQVLNMSGDAMVAAFTNKEIDAAAIWTPTFNKLQQVTGAHKLFIDTDTSIYKQYGFGAGPDVLVVSKKFYDANKDAVKKFMVAYYKSLAWMRDNPDQATQILKDLTKLSDQEQKDIITSVKWTDIDKQKASLGDNGNMTNTMDFLQKFLADNKLIGNSVQVKDWIKTDVVP